MMEKVDRIVEQLQKACKESTAYKEVKAYRIGRSYVCAQRRNQFDSQNHLTWNMKIIKHRREECKREGMNGMIIIGGITFCSCPDDFRVKSDKAGVQYEYTRKVWQALYSLCSSKHHGLVLQNRAERKARSAPMHVMYIEFSLE